MFSSTLHFLWSFFFYFLVAVILVTLIGAWKNFTQENAKASSNYSTHLTTSSSLPAPSYELTRKKSDDSVYETDEEEDERRERAREKERERREKEKERERGREEKERERRRREEEVEHEQGEDACDRDEPHVQGNVHWNLQVRGAPHRQSTSSDHGSGPENGYARA